MGWISEGDDWGVDGINFDYLKRKLSPEEEAQHAKDSPPDKVVDYLLAKTKATYAEERRKDIEQWPWAPVPEFWNNLPSPVLAGPTFKNTYWEVLAPNPLEFRVREWTTLPPHARRSGGLSPSAFAKAFKALARRWVRAEVRIHAHTDLNFNQVDGQFSNWSALLERRLGVSRKDSVFLDIQEALKPKHLDWREVFLSLYAKPDLWPALLAEAQAEAEFPPRPKGGLRY